MTAMDAFPAQLVEWAGPMLVTLLLAAFVYWLLGKTFTNQPNNRLYRQLAYVGLFVATLIILVIAQVR